MNDGFGDVQGSLNNWKQLVEHWEKWHHWTSGMGTKKACTPKPSLSMMRENQRILLGHPSARSEFANLIQNNLSIILYRYQPKFPNMTFNDPKYLDQFILKRSQYSIVPRHPKIAQDIPRYLQISPDTPRYPKYMGYESHSHWFFSDHPVVQSPEALKLQLRVAERARVAFGWTLRSRGLAPSWPHLATGSAIIHQGFGNSYCSSVYIHIYIYVYTYDKAFRPLNCNFQCMNYKDLIATSLEWCLVWETIPKLPCFCVGNVDYLAQIMINYWL